MTFAESVSKVAAPIFQIDLSCITLVANIINCFIHPAVPDGLLLIEAHPESLQDRVFLLEMQLLPFFIIIGILFANGI